MNTIVRVVNAVVRWIVGRVVYPFKDGFPYFLLLFIANSWVCCGMLAVTGGGIYSIIVAMFFYVLTYVQVLIANISRLAGKILNPLFLCVSVAICALNVFCLYRYKSRLPIIVLANTNIGEMREYIEAYFSWGAAAIFLAAIVLSGFLMCRLAMKMNTAWINRKYISVCFVLLTVSGISSWRHPDVIPYLLKITSFADIEKYEYTPTHPQIESSGNSAPAFVVIILGESFAPSHSSLYGYEKLTNPLLENKYETGNLFIFTRVLSPGTRTADVFRSLLNTYLTDTTMTQQWFNCTSLIEVMNTAGYHTFWLSNQEENGLITNIPGGHSKICDDAVFFRARYDGTLLDYELPKTNERNAVFYHLWGQHFLFQERYPKEFDVFKPEDYENSAKENQRETLAYYDNATLYNDFIVNSIIDRYKDGDAVIFYVPDHGLDMFDTDSGYCGHAMETPESKAVARKIPFMIYLSPLYQELRPEITERIKNAADRAFCTDRLIYAVMDALSLRFSDNDDVNKYSLFSDL